MDEFGRSCALSLKINVQKSEPIVFKREARFSKVEVKWGRNLGGKG